jgi:preprotein translocase subunit SecG
MARAEQAAMVVLAILFVVLCLALATALYQPPGRFVS